MGMIPNFVGLQIITCRWLLIQYDLEKLIKVKVRGHKRSNFRILHQYSLITQKVLMGMIPNFVGLQIIICRWLLIQYDLEKLIKVKVRGHKRSNFQLFYQFSPITQKVLTGMIPNFACVKILIWRWLLFWNDLGKFIIPRSCDLGNMILHLSRKP